MLDRGNGRVINLSSGAAEQNIKGTSAYNASKAGLERFSGTLATELEETGVVVTALRPGVVDTPMQAQLRQSSTHRFPRVAEWQALHQQGHLRPPEEPAWAIVWLASHFGRNTNGQTFSMNDERFRQQLTADLQLDSLLSQEGHGSQ
jgi:benzil reductase ((S)-benzoin forming)